MGKTIEDIIDFIEEYATRVGRQLQEEEIVKFVKGLQQKIGEMNFSVPKGTAVIAYTGTYNDIQLHRTTAAISKAMGDGATYISDLPAGELLNNND